MSVFLSTVNWGRLFSYNLTADSMWSAFSNVLYAAIDLFVSIRSIKKVRNSPARRYPSTVKRAAARKKCLWRKLCAKPDCSVTKSAYKMAAAKHKLMVRNYEIKKEQNLIASNNAGQFFNFVNRKLSSKSGIGALLAAISPDNTHTAPLLTTKVTTKRQCLLTHEKKHKTNLKQTDHGYEKNIKHTVSVTKI